MEEKAILIAPSLDKIPENYEIVLKLPIPNTIRAMRDRTMREEKTIQVAVPKMLPPSCQLDRSSSQ